MVLSEMEEIEEVIDAYLKGVKTGDDQFFEKAFRNDSVVINASETDEVKMVTPIADFVNRIKDRHREGVHLEEIPLGITTNYIAKVANVRLDFRLEIGEQALYGTDYFNMVKQNGKWKISQKIYDVTKVE
jgi:hypothetical protein